MLDQIDRSHRYLNVDRDEGRRLRIFAESLGAKYIVEIGASTGYSGIWLASRSHCGLPARGDFQQAARWPA